MGRVVAIYDYRDSDGAVYAQKLRREPGPNGASKSFSWRRSLPPEQRDQFGIGPEEPAWVWGMEEGQYAPHEGDVRDWRSWRGTPGTAPGQQPAQVVKLPTCAAGLYRLPDLLAEPFENPIAIVEGEKKAHLLCGLGVCAVSGPNGARCWNHSWAKYFADRLVIVIPDNNTAGLGHATAVTGSLLLHGVTAVKLIVPGERWDVQPNQDVGDWLAAIAPGDRKAAFRQLLTRFPAFRRAA